MNYELENADMSTFYFSKVRHFDTLELVSGTIDTSLIIDRAYFQLDLQHPLQSMQTDIEALVLIDRVHKKPYGLALCTLEQPGRSLMFPLFRNGELILKDNSPTHITMICCPCENPKTVILRSRDPEQINIWIWKLESIFGKNTNEDVSVDLGSSQRGSFGLGISMSNSSSASSLDNNLTAPIAIKFESLHIPDPLSSTQSLTDQLKEYLIDDESPEDTKPDVSQDKLERAREVRRQIELELLEKEKLRDEQRKLNRLLEVEITRMVTPPPKKQVVAEADKQPLLSTSSSSSSFSSSESQKISRIRELLRKPAPNAEGQLPSNPPSIPLSSLSPAESRMSVHSVLSHRSSIQESIFLSNRGDLDKFELNDQPIIAPDFGGRDLDLSLTPTVPPVPFTQPPSPPESSDDCEEYSTSNSPEVAPHRSSDTKGEMTLKKKPSLAGLMSISFKNISSKLKQKTKTPGFEIIDPENVPEDLKTPKLSETFVMDSIREEEYKPADSVPTNGSAAEDTFDPPDLIGLRQSLMHRSPELELSPERDNPEAKQTSIITDPLGTAVCIESNNTTVQASSSGSNISVRSLRSKPSFSSSSSFSSLRIRKSEEQDLNSMKSEIPPLPQSILKEAGSGVTIFRGMARISQWQTMRWVSLTEKEIYIEVNVAGEGGYVSGSSKIEGAPQIELWLHPNHEVRKSTMQDVQITQTNHITMFRLKDAEMADRFLGAVEVARIDVKNQPLLYAKDQNYGKRAAPPSLNSNSSSLGSIQSALAHTERAREQLLNPKSPGSPIVLLPPILSTKNAGRKNGCCSVIPEGAVVRVPDAVRQTAARLLLLNNLRCRMFERGPLGDWTRTSDLARLSVFSVPGTSMKSIMVRRIENKGEPLLYEEALPVAAFSRVGKVGVGISYEVGEDERELRYVIQMKADKEAAYIYDLLKQDATN